VATSSGSVNYHFTANLPENLPVKKNFENCLRFDKVMATSKGHAVDVTVRLFRHASVIGWLGSRVVSMLDSGAAWVQIAAMMLVGNSLRQIVHTHRASIHHAAKFVVSPLKGSEGYCGPGGK